MWLTDPDADLGGPQKITDPTDPDPQHWRKPKLNVDPSAPMKPFHVCTIKTSVANPDPNADPDT